MDCGLNKKLLRNAASKFIPKGIAGMRKKIRKPGSNVAIIYNAFYDELFGNLMELIEAGILHESATKALETDKKNNDFHKSFFWMRVYILQIWRQVNADRCVQN